MLRAGLALCFLTATSPFLCSRKKNKVVLAGLPWAVVVVRRRGSEREVLVPLVNFQQFKLFFFSPVWTFPYLDLWCRRELIIHSRLIVEKVLWIMWPDQYKPIFCNELDLSWRLLL